MVSLWHGDRWFQPRSAGSLPSSSAWGHLSSMPTSTASSSARESGGLRMPLPTWSTSPAGALTPKLSLLLPCDVICLLLGTLLSAARSMELLVMNSFCYWVSRRSLYFTFFFERYLCWYRIISTSVLKVLKISLYISLWVISFIVSLNSLIISYRVQSALHPIRWFSWLEACWGLTCSYSVFCLCSSFVTTLHSGLITLSVSCSAQYNTCVSSDLYSTDRFFSRLHVVFLCFFAELVMLD